MITEERLKELTKERKDFFEASIYDDIPRKINIKEIDISKPFVFYDDENSNAERVFYNLLSGQLCSVDLERIFETEEEAKWYLEFGNIARVEKLSLPTFDEFKDKAGGLMFYIKTGYVLLSISDDRKMVYIQGDELIFNAPLTKENYIDACKICKRLFLEGEE